MPTFYRWMLAATGWAVVDASVGRSGWRIVADLIWLSGAFVLAGVLWGVWWDAVALVMGLAPSRRMRKHGMKEEAWDEDGNVLS